MLWRLTKCGYTTGCNPYDSQEYDLIALGASKEGVFSNVLFAEIPKKVARYPRPPGMIVQRWEAPVMMLVKRVMD